MVTVPRTEDGQYSSAGRKPRNEDSHGLVIPSSFQARAKGIAIAIADGLSSSAGAKEASETCIKMFLQDYYATPETWDVKTSVLRILNAANRWLIGQGIARYGEADGMATTFTGCVLAAGRLHVFHIGDTRLTVLRKGSLKQVTVDHRDRPQGAALSRAMGLSPGVDLDYTQLESAAGDILVLTSDGVHDYVGDDDIMETIAACEGGLAAAARTLAQLAHARGSADNLTCQIVKIFDPGSGGDGADVLRPVPPLLSAGQRFEGYTIMSELHASSRTQLYRAVDDADGSCVVIKALSPHFSEDLEAAEAFCREIWAAAMIDNPQVMKLVRPARRRQHLFYTAEYIEGQTLSQWLLDHQSPDLAAVRPIADQIIKGLRGFHRKQFVHLDLKPGNIMIDQKGHLKIIDFGSAAPMGAADGRSAAQPTQGGTLNYVAPECLRGEPATNRADIYSLGVIVYEMLTGQLPYGRTTDAAFSRWQKPYRPARQFRPELPAWIDFALERAVHPRPNQRYEAMSVFFEDLKRPSPAFNMTTFKPLIERNPIAFWRTLAIFFFLSSLALLAALYTG